MVGPSTDEERRSLTMQMKAFFVILVGASTGLISLQADATLLEIGLLTLVGLAVGAVLVWFVFPDFEGVRRER